jgi:hypothetical protein
LGGTAEAVPFPNRILAVDVGKAILELETGNCFYGESKETTFQGADGDPPRSRPPDGALAFRVPELPRAEIAASRLPEMRLL